MNITQLKYFRTVADYQNVSRASEELHISQPSLSNAIKELEREFNVTLFYRRNRKMILTSAGVSLYNVVEDLISRYDRTERMMMDIGKQIRSLRLGIPPMIGSLLLPRIYRDFILQNPDIDIKITEHGRDELLSQLEDDMVDMVILPHIDPFGEEFAAVQVGEFEIACCANKGSRMAEYKSIDAKALREVPIVLFADSFFQTKEIKLWFSRGGVTPNLLLQTEQLSTAQRIIENGIAVGFMFNNLAKKLGDTVAIPMVPPISMHVSLLRKKSIYMSGSMKKFKDFMTDGNPFEELCIE